MAGAFRDILSDPIRFGKGVPVLFLRLFARRLVLPLALAAGLLAGCAGQKPEGAGAGADEARPAGRAAGSSSEAPASLYLQLVDGLHVTGTPVEVDVETFRLRVEGEVERPLSLSLEQIRALPAVREEISLECPGFFTDHGVWTGVRVRDLLALAGLRPGAARVVFTSLSQGYTSTLGLEGLEGDGVLVAYEFEGKPFPVVHGFPLRLTARDHPGSVWVKWLGEIRVSQ
jgi:DMSO/TMAO reductase YedYZ molybdopterin-dependent catalytic subunit